MFQINFSIMDADFGENESVHLRMRNAVKGPWPSFWFAVGFGGWLKT